MADQRARELGGRDKGKAKAWELEDGPSSFPDFSSACGPVSFAPDGGIDDGAEQMQTDEEEESRDPLVIFGSGIMMMILSKLDARSVALARSVSRDWLAVASSDKIWAPKDLFHMCKDWYLNLNFRSASVRGVETTILGKDVLSTTMN